MQYGRLFGDASLIFDCARVIPRVHVLNRLDDQLATLFSGTRYGNTRRDVHSFIVKGPFNAEGQVTLGNGTRHGHGVSGIDGLVAEIKGGNLGRHWN